jgi:hypothetical protein
VIKINFWWPQQNIPSSMVRFKMLITHRSILSISLGGLWGSLCRFVVWLFYGSGFLLLAAVMQLDKE